MNSFPQFKYHPNPLETGSITESDKECRSCNQKRGFIYAASVYSSQDLDNSICPWCIADGSAAAKLGASFVDDFNLFKTRISEEIITEVAARTPGYISWQPECWETHCKDACEFHGDLAKHEMKALSQEAVEFFRSELDLNENEWIEFTRNYTPGGDPAIYKFVCRHCGKTIYNWDCS
jgi:uncharacterized protein CbrC (UPF0167 family)